MIKSINNHRYDDDADDDLLNNGNLLEEGHFLKELSNFFHRQPHSSAMTS